VISIATINAPVISYSPSSYIFTTGVSSSVSAPTNTGGAATSFSIAGTLPAGLSFNTGTGAITGTPTATSLATGYTVTATNASGSNSAVVTITVNPPAPVISYTTPQADTIGIPIHALSPSNSGGTPVTYSAALPAGLSINVSTGVISGTPLAASASASYTVTATNAGGSSTFNIAISVADNLIFPTLATHIYGDANFSPGATSSLPVTYTSSNTSIATIVSGQIHIVAAGTVNITASDGTNSLTRSLLISKAPLTISADSKSKSYNTANPTLTVSYSGFVNGETSANLSARPSVSTTAVTSSQVGYYPITASGATAVNYVIVYNGAFLHVTP
jgi:hypothetical protein